MIKRILVLSLAVIMIAALPLVVFAANQTTATTTLTYTVNEPPPLPPPPSATWEINIPATINLNMEQDILVTANHVSITEANRAVFVSLLGQTFDNQTVWLTNAGPDRIGVMFYFIHDNLGIVRVGSQSAGSTLPIAVFYDGDTTPSRGGLLRAVVSSEDVAAARSGTYSGTVHFNIWLGHI